MSTARTSTYSWATATTRACTIVEGLANCGFVLVSKPAPRRQTVAAISCQHYKPFAKLLPLIFVLDLQAEPHATTPKHPLSTTSDKALEQFHQIYGDRLPREFNSRKASTHTRVGTSQAHIADGKHFQANAAIVSQT